MMWCPAVAAAWHTLYGIDGPTLLQTALQPPDDATALAVFLHQIAHLHCSLLGRTETTIPLATGRIVRACQGSAFQEEPDDQDENEEACPLTDQEAIAAWTHEQPDCASCATAWAPAAIRSSAAPATTRRGARGGGELTRRPVAATAVGPGHPWPHYMETPRKPHGCPLAVDGGQGRDAQRRTRRTPTGVSHDAHTAGDTRPAWSPTRI